MHYTHILLDADETIFDFKKAEAISLSSLLEEEGVTPSEEVVALYHRINDGWWKRFEQKEVTTEQLSTGRFADFAEAIGLEGRDPEQLSMRYRANLGMNGVLLPGALETVKLLAPYYELYIITNGIADTQHKRFDTSPVREYISGMFISQEMGVSKPDTAYFDHVLDTIGITDRSKALVVGDSLRSDIQGGIASGLDTCWVDRKNTGNTEGLQPTYIISDIQQLAPLLGVDA